MPRNFNPPHLFDYEHLVIDTETDGLDWKVNKIVGYVLTWGPNDENSLYFPTRHAEGENYDHDVVTAWVKELVTKPVKSTGRLRTFTGHHMKFDMHMLANEGIYFSFGQVSCTQVVAALIDENQGTYSLENCCDVMKVQAKKGQPMYEHIAKQFGCPPTKDAMAHFWRLSADDFMVHEYAAGDGVSTWQLEAAQAEVVAYQELGRVKKVEDGIVRTLMRTERRGVRVDRDRFGVVTSRLEVMLAERESKLPAGFNAKSGKQVLAYILSKGIELESIPHTAKGNPQLNEKYLETIEPGNDIILVRKIKTLMSSFVEGQINTFVTDAGKIHTNFNQMKADDYGTVTGRLSSNAPNLQQVPKRDKILAPLFRSIFCPDEGMVWSSNDYKQQEYVVFADYSGSDRLRDGYNREIPVDIHTMVANEFSRLLGREIERDPTAKRLNLGKLYGMGVAKLAASLNISIREAKVLSDLWDKDVCPEGKNFLKLAESRAKRNGYVYDYLGRRRRFGVGGNPYQAGNAVIQMCSASITKLKMLEIDQYFEKMGDECQLILQVHDELDWQMPDRPEYMEQDKEARRIMESFGPDDQITLDVKLGVDASYGKNWAMASFGREQ